MSTDAVTNDVPTAPMLPLSAEARERMHGLYRRLHASPELSMQEHATAALIQAELSSAGIENFLCGGTGVVGILRNGAGPTVAFRADIDGLPIEEETGLEYASSAVGVLADGTTVPVMHGCGHDMHTSVLLTTARMLAEAAGQWAGTVVFLFQPGEETAAGARAMIADGLWLRAPRPSVVFGQHVMPGLAGTVAYRPGAAMAQADAWRVTVLGTGAHASQPQRSVDPILLAAQMVTRIQSIVSREIDPRSPAVVTVATFHAGTKENIIPSSAEFTLNVRTLDPGVRDHVLEALRRVISAEALAARAEQPLIEELYTFPLNYNDPEVAHSVAGEFRRLLGDAAVREIEPDMGSEDFGLLAETIGVPSFYWFVGGDSAESLASGDPVPANHSPRFAPVPEPTLSTAVAAATTAILSTLTP
jgi:amidohydrolase